MMNSSMILDAVEYSFQDPSIRERSYYPAFRRQWLELLEKTADSAPYFDFDDPGCYMVSDSFAGIDAEFHIDQRKVADWYRQDFSRRKHVVFLAKTFKFRKDGILEFHDSLCTYDAKAPEPALTDSMRNTIAAAFPGLPPRLSVIYGNKWVEERFHRKFRTRFSMFLVETDYMPAFLGSPFEVCLYLFMMDYCIIKENYSKVKDEDLKGFLHIFRPSPMLKIKGIL